MRPRITGKIKREGEIVRLMNHEGRTLASSHRFAWGFEVRNRYGQWSLRTRDVNRAARRMLELAF